MAKPIAKAFLCPTDPNVKPPREDGKEFPAAGMEVELTTYYRRRIADGSLALKCAPAVEAEESDVN